MLSLPARLVFGNPTKMDFKLSQVDGIARLYSERHIPYHDSKYWSRFLQLDTATQVYSLLSLADLRRASKSAPENLVTLVRVMVAHLESLLVDPWFEPPASSGAPDANQQASGLAARLNGLADVSKWKELGGSLMWPDSAQVRPTSDHRDRTKEALNVIRILTRTLPAVMESDDASFEHQVLWTQAPDAYTHPDASQNTGANAVNPGTDQPKHELDSSTHFVIDDDHDNQDDQATRAPSVETSRHPLSTDQSETHNDQEPIPVALGERLVTLVVDLLFCSGFSLPWTQDQLEQGAASASARRIHYSIWQAGVGSSVDLRGTTRWHLSNRVELLRLLLVLLSKSIYIPAHLQTTQANPALAFAVRDLDQSVMLPLMCSLINTSIANARSSTAAWFGLPAVGSLVGASNDQVRTDLVTLSLQVLDVLLTYPGVLAPDTDTASLSPTTLGRPLRGPGGRNVFRFYLSKLHRTADFDWIWTGMSRWFNEHVNSTTQMLAIPIALRGRAQSAAETSAQLTQVAERLVLLWQLLEHNRKFRAFVLDDPMRAPELLRVLLYFALSYKANVAMQGLVRLCAFMLQDVSSEPSFAVQLAKPASAAKVELPRRLGLAAANTAIDYLVQGVYNLIATTHGQLATLYAPLVISLTNTAPAWRNLSISASTRILHLLTSFSQPAFLLSEERNPRLLFYVLQTINAVLTCAFQENVNLVYSLVLARGLVEELETFELRKAVEQVWARRRSVGTDTRDWFEGHERLQKREHSTSGVTDEHAACNVDKGKARRLSSSSTERARGAMSKSEYCGELCQYPLHVVESVAARYIGKHAFRPTQAWVESWHSRLPLCTPRLVIDRLLPDIERIAALRSSSAKLDTTAGDTDARVLAYLREQRIPHLTPPVGGFHPRPWSWTDHALVWLSSYLWGLVYLNGLLPWGVWSDTEVSLFRLVRDAQVTSSNAPPAPPRAPEHTHMSPRSS